MSQQVSQPINLLAKVLEKLIANLILAINSIPLIIRI